MEHSYGMVSDEYNFVFSEWNTYEFLKLLFSQTLVKVTIPVFFVISGYLFFSNVKVWSFCVYREKIIRRIRRLFIPYLVWNLLMAFKLKILSWDIFWVFWKPAGKQIDWLGNEQLMTAPINLPLWFLRDLIVMSLLTPIIYIVIRRFGYRLIVLLTIFYLSGLYAFIPGLSAYAVYFFTIGAFLSIHKMNLIESLRQLEIPAYVFSVILVFCMLFSFHTPIFSSLMLIFRLTGGFAAFCVASRFFSYTRFSVPNVVCDSAYFIYLAHYVFFFSFIDEAFFSLFGISDPSLCMHYLLCPLIKVAIFVGLYYFYTIIRKPLLQLLL